MTSNNSEDEENDSQKILQAINESKSDEELKEFFI